MTPEIVQHLLADAEIAADLFGLDLAWREIAGWRVNYDTVLLALCSITMPPPPGRQTAPSAFRTPTVFVKRPLR